MNKSYPYLFFISIVVFVTIAFIGLIQEFLLAVFWATILSVLFQNMHNRIGLRIGNKPNLTAALTLVTIFIVVILPLLLIGYAVIMEGINYYQQIESGNLNISGKLDNLKAKVPIVENFLRSLSLDVESLRASFNSSVTNLSKAMAGKAFAFTQNIVGFLVQFALMLYMLYFFLRDGKWLIEKLVWALPIGDKEEWALIKRFESVARATVKGSLVVAMTQGLAGGILFWAVGIPGAMLWGVLMTLVSLLPMGSGIIWLPAAIIMYVQGHIAEAIIIVLVGALLIGLLDNLLRPSLVGNDTKMPDYLILISTLGGLSWFGISGFVLGPIIAALFVTCWEMLGNGEGNSSDGS